MTRDQVRRFVIALALGAIYYWCLVTTIGISLALVLPPFLPRSTAGVVPWQELTHLVAVILAALPIAAALKYMMREQALRWGLVIGVGTALYGFIPTVLDTRLTIFTPFWWGALFVVAHVKIGVMPALLIWLFQRLMPSNQPLHPTQRG